MSEAPHTGQPDIRTASRGEVSRSARFRRTFDAAVNRAEVVAAVLLALSTVLTAWCAYQATRWSGVQATSFAQASTDRIESTREYDKAIQLLSIDASTFMQWVDAYAAGNSELVQFYQANIMRPEFLPYLNIWVMSEPLQNPGAQRNPLVNEAYQQTLFEPSEKLRADAAVKFNEATDANQTGDEYILATVIFASVLFFAGISTKFESVRIQAGLVLMGFGMFVIGLVQVGGLPIH